MLEIKKFRRIPLIIEAIKYMGEWPQINADLKDWGLTDWHFGHWDMQHHAHCLVIHTLEGEMECEIGDYLIKGIANAFYPCKAHIFEASYESCE